MNMLKRNNIPLNEWSTFNVVMPSHLVFMTYGTLITEHRLYHVSFLGAEGSVAIVARPARF
jgi:hypothetical protein